AGDRPPVRQPRSHHGAPRHPQDRAAHERRQSAARGDRASEEAATRLGGLKLRGNGAIRPLLPLLQICPYRVKLKREFLAFIAPFRGLAGSLTASAGMPATTPKGRRSGLV